MTDLSPHDALKRKHARYVLTPWSAQGKLSPPVITRAEGRTLYDVDGNGYLDLSAGLVAVNLGHSHPRLVQAIQEQAARLCYSPPSYFQDGRAELGELLSQLAPWPEGARVFFTTGGAEANEDAIRMARAITGRDKVLAAYRSFHGATGAAITLTGEDRRWGAEPGTPGILHFWTPYPYRSPFFTDDPTEETARALAHLERTLLHENPSRIAAIVIEPMVGSNGAILYSDGYLAGLRALCDKHGILLIFDEVMTGFGRVGAAFAAQRFSVTPDMIVFAKGVTSAYSPLGGVLLREGLAQTFDARPLPCGHTYAGHPLAVGTGLAAVRIYQDETLFTRALELEGWLREGLSALQSRHEIVGDVRGIGAFFALEFVKDRASREELVPWHGAGMGMMATFYAELRARGVYAFGRYNVAIISPPLTITRAELDFGLEALDAAAGALERAL